MLVAPLFVAVVAMEKLLSWYCGRMVAEPRIFHNRVVDYHYVAVDGCGQLNRPGAGECWNCGRAKPGKDGNPGENAEMAS